ncbi:hypothetical protein BRM10_22405 [Xanthomonas oryzae pv. oryzae]|nr:hypothetical protein BRM10_22405 [Xanthomonas oryzae pv. oryzae]RBH24503.1 hypothetical protein BRM15_06160 [Xanthomonas oryzae pv. oryzae]
MEVESNLMAAASVAVILWLHVENGSKFIREATITASRLVSQSHHWRSGGTPSSLAHASR